MSAIGGAFGVLIGLIGLLFACVGAGLGITLLCRMRWRGRALTHGLAAQARVLDTYVTHSSRIGPDQPGDTSTRHVILGFRTQDGRDIRIEDTSGLPRVIGDLVQVRYLPERPERAAVAGTSSVGAGVGLALGLAFCVVFTCGGLFFAAMGFGVGWLGFGTESEFGTVIDPGMLP
ncbi:DUF3592 domain-containing protein [Streptomyces sp. NPDC051569]|uniref:DUF3592 domain-containing protein n=1 Tax=Streptomyces sp. NPDC051569 TaxID=3365661 RepID=UPI00379A92CE